MSPASAARTEAAATAVRTVPPAELAAVMLAMGKRARAASRTRVPTAPDATTLARTAAD
ncbi:hypothetical protein V5F49_06250 [Xanthobacter sp. V3C-3]|uniref:hypothetical protein n=1 Tax=Xanthobacter lutulentifluminis TaxID=3119935 RepID=UPI00372686F4